MRYAGRNGVINLADGHLSEHVPHWKHNVALDPPLAANSSVNSDTTVFMDEALRRLHISVSIISRIKNKSIMYFHIVPVIFRF
jgi:hypothetical protein